MSDLHKEAENESGWLAECLEANVMPDMEALARASRVFCRLLSEYEYLSARLAEVEDDLKSVLAREAATTARYDARLAEVEKERDECKKWLGELLAVIHRDGGHYLDENGPEFSVRDAHKVWADREDKT